MRKKQLIILFLLVCLAVFFSSCGRQGGWGKYIKVLQKYMFGLTPYWIPNPKDGPGTILEVVNGAEQLVYSASSAFPNLSPESVEVPSFVVTEVTSIKFNIGMKADDEKILPLNIAAAVKFAYKNDTNVSLAINQPKLFRIETGLIAEALKSFDLSNARQEEILRKLMQPNAILISGALRLNGFKFTFDNVSKLEADQEAKLSKYIADENLKYERLTDTQFCLVADTPMYLAYYAYPIDSKQMKLLYDDLQRIKEAKKTAENMAKIELQMPNVAHTSLEQLTDGLKMINGQLGEMRNREKKLAAARGTTTDEGDQKKLDKQLAELRNQIRAGETKTNGINLEIKAVEQYFFLRQKSLDDTDFLKKFKVKKYSLFGKEKIISERLKGLI